MVVKADQERVRTLLRDTITLLCKNGLEYHDKFSVDAVIGVTVDEGDVFLVSMNDIIWSERSRLQQATSSTTEPDGARRKKRRKRKRVKTEGGEEVSSNGSASSESDDGAQPPKRLPVVSKQEPISEPEDVDEDIVVIKEELDTWGADSFSGANPHLGDPNTDPAYYGGDQSYGDMGYHDQSWPSTTSTPQRGQYQMGRTATVTSASPGTSGGDMAQDPGLGAQQLQDTKHFDAHPAIEDSCEIKPDLDLGIEEVTPNPKPTQGHVRNHGLLGNKNSQRPTRTVGFGWLHYDEYQKNYRQVRGKTGGGAFKMVLPKEFTKEQLLQIAKNIFFPNGMSSKGPMEHFDVDLKDFQHCEMGTDNLGEMYELHKMKMLRFYLATKIRSDVTPRMRSQYNA